MAEIKHLDPKDIGPKHVDIQKVLANKKVKLPNWMVSWMERLLHLDEVNSVIYQYRDKFGLDFVHAFYDHYLDVNFLITTITVKNNKVGMIFSIDQNALGNTDLARRTASQFAKLELNDRLHKAGILFVNDMIGGFVCTNDRELAASLMQKETFLKGKYGRNDWRTSIVRGLRQCVAFNMQVVNAMRNPFNLRPINGGGS